MNRGVDPGRSIRLTLIAGAVMAVLCDVSKRPTIAQDEVAVDQNDQEVVSQFLQEFCLQCHDTSSREGDREFETLSLPLTSESLLITADEIVDQVTLREMPPPDVDQPTDQQRLAVIAALRSGIQDARHVLSDTGGRTVLRRLSHREYENTLAVLMDRRVDTLGLTAGFPKENVVEHLDNLGEALIMSGFLLDQYFQAADRLVETRLGKPDVEKQSWHFTGNFRQYEELEGPHKRVFNFKYLCLYEQPNTDTRQGGYGHIEDFLHGVPVSGYYDIAVHAQSLHRDTHYDPEIFRIDFSEPFQIAVVPGDVTKGHIHYPQSIEPILADAIVPDDRPEWIEFRVWLEAGQTPRFIFPNGPYESRASVIKVNRRYDDEFTDKRGDVDRGRILIEGKLPHIRIDQIKIEGPVAESPVSREESAVFGPEGFQADVAIEQLDRFAAKAYRRPLTAEDRRRIESIYQRRLGEDASPRQAALDTVKLILCSPSFLYLSEITPEDDPLLRPYDLASRLSYALWVQPPDESLSAAAASGELMQPDELRRQIRRMLDDSRSERFIQSFVDGWLNLRDIGNLPPPRPSALDYYAQNLPTSMKREAYLYFEDLLRNDASVLRFLDGDYVFVDKYLAKLYGLPEGETMRLADGFRRVDLRGNRQRGGVLGMAGVLTVSANGVDTSPVTRGVWVSENLLGITPPPPPDEVPAIDADVSGATTIREKLALHSQDAACAECHRKIDPLGYSLEQFDPIGRWRDRYPGSKDVAGRKIDPSGQLISGESYEDIDGFKTLLHSTRQERFVRALVDKLMSYSTGRPMRRGDAFERDDIIEAARPGGFGLKTLVTEVLCSGAFRSG